MGSRVSKRGGERVLPKRGGLKKPGLPRFIVISVYSKPGYVCYENESNEIACGEESVFSTLVKIEVEPAKIDKNLVHLRFCHNNKYWARDAEAADGSIVAKSNQPEEDESKSTCTLFRPTFGQAQLFFLNHVQSGGRVQLNDFSPSLYVNEDPNFNHNSFVYLDWDTLVKLPEHVAFKGYNGKYLSAVWTEGYPYLKFSSDDPNEDTSGHQVQLMPDGYIRIQSDYYNNLWRRSPNWIWGDSCDGEAGDNDTLFWPVKIDDNTIALRNKGNGNFCKSLSVEGKTDCLNAAVSTITKEARLGVEELVLERKIYNVKYRMDDARIFNEKPYVAGTTTAVNRSDEAASISVEVGYDDVRSYSFSRSISVTAGVKTTIEANVLCIEKAVIEFSFEVRESFEWANTTTKRTSVKATGSVSVPGKSVAKVHYVGTMGTCNVPFDYTQQDRSSTDGRIVQTQVTDGVFNDVNCYNFNFEILEIQPL